MKKMTSNEVRQMWLDFWTSKGHQVVDSAPLVPHNDPTLLWINSGVAALKKYFDGSSKPENPRLVNSQKCIRTNDIENVGLTARHQTLFEMLGHFSIGDYFKEDAIRWEYELMTSPEWFGLEKDKLYITVYPSDQEARMYWENLGVAKDHILETNYNYWEIGNGPCGPCSEMFYDRGESFGDFTPKAIQDDVENDRYIEIGNIVFSQFNAKEGLSRDEYPELPQKNIDMGGGLERILSILQDTPTNFETDLFYPTIQEVERLSGVKYEGQTAFKVIADHVRSVTFAIADGAMLSNEGRGYVLRRVLRRAIKHARSLGFTKPFMYDLVDIVVNNMGKHYTYLFEKMDLVKQVIKREEEKFFDTLENGVKIFDSISGNHISGKDAFMLYDTYGFPIELTLEYAEEQGKTVDRAGFEEEMEAQRNRARNARQDMNSMAEQDEEFLSFMEKSVFVGYDQLETASKIIGIFGNKVVLDKTPFYAESGGQVADRGVIVYNHEEYEVIDVQKMPNGQHIHTLSHLEDLFEGEDVTARVDEHARNLTMYNHSTIHLMFSVLRDKLGPNIGQSGSFVNDEYFRFDFSNFEPLSDDEILAVEAQTNALIQQAYPVVITEETLDAAKSKGAIAEFGEKYGSLVRVVDMGATVDLCGGTHVKNIGDIKQMAIYSVESKGSGVFRVEGVANEGVKDFSKVLKQYNQMIGSILEKAEKLIHEASLKGLAVKFNYKINQSTKGSYQDVIDKRNELKHVQDLVKELDKEVKQLTEAHALEDLEQFEEMITGSYLVGSVKNFDTQALKQVADLMLEKMKSGFVFIANVVDGKVVFIAKSNNGIHCGNMVKAAAQICDGNGGGRPDFAQAGGKDPDKVEEALLHVKGLL